MGSAPHRHGFPLKMHGLRQTGHGAEKISGEEFPGIYPPQRSGSRIKELYARVKVQENKNCLPPLRQKYLENPENSAKII